MNNEQLKDLAEQTLRPLLGPLGLQKIEVAAGRDHDGEESLFVTALYPEGSKAPSGQTLIEALTHLRRAFVGAGEERFPYLDHRFGAEDGFEEDADVEEADLRGP